MRLSQLIVLGVLLGVGVGWWLRRDAGEPVAVVAPAPQPAVAAAPAKASAVPHANAPASASLPTPASASDAPVDLLLPVQGVLPSQLRDTFTDARSEGRVTSWPMPEHRCWRWPMARWRNYSAASAVG